MRNQRKDVLEYLQRNGSITQIEAYREFEAPITRLASVIHDLRKAGHDIETRDCIGKNCYGTIQYGMYVYHGMKEDVE